MSEELRLLLGLYFSTSASSIMMNAFLNERNHQENGVRRHDGHPDPDGRAELLE